MPVQFIGPLKDFTKEQADNIVRITEHYHNKIKIKIPKFLLKVHIKKHKKTGNRIKFSIHLRLETPNIIAVAESHDWDLIRVLHDCFKKLQRELAHKFKLEGHLPKPR